jgi:hypothetical protein
MRRSPRSPFALAAATLLAFLWSAAHPLDAEGAKKKKKKPAPAPAASATTTVELDTPAAAPPAPAPAPATPAPAPEAAPPADKAAPDEAPPPAAAKHAAAPDRFDPLGAKHTLVLDDLSGFRASTAGGIGYAGPLGFSTQSYSVNVFGANGAVAGTDTIHATTIWLAPSFDYFLFEHLSIGGVLELAWNSSSYDQSIYGTATKSQSLPSTVNFTLVPRVGYMFQLAEHWGLWPRVGMGLGVLQQNAITQAGASTASASSSLTYLLDIDLGVLYRLDSRFYLRAGPEFTWGPGAGLTDFQVVGGFGYLWSL